MTALRTKIQAFSRERLMLILGVYILCQPLLDILTSLGVNAGHPVTAGVVVRSLFMAACVLYAVFISQFEGKKLPMIYLGVLVGYLALFMVYMLSVGGLSLCFANVTEVVKTFFAPFVLIFLYCIYRQYGFFVTTQAIGGAGAIYCGVILLAFLTGTSNPSYPSSGYGYNGWFYAANEIGCIIALTAPFTVYHCIKAVPTVTKKTWWKALIIVWCLFSVAFSANFIGTKIVFLFNLVYALAALVWLLFRLYRERTPAVLAQVGAVLLLVVLILGFYRISALKQYKDDIYDPYGEQDSSEVITWWPSELQDACEGTWLAELVDVNPVVQKLDQILSRRLYSAAPSVEVFLEGGIGAKLLGVGYADCGAYSRDIHFMIEMDPPAVLIRHGLVGFVVYCVPYFAFILWAIVQFFKRPLQRLESLRCCTLLYCTLAAFAIAIMAGHALVSPAVSTFVLVIGTQLWIVIQEQNKLPNPKTA